VSDHHPDPTPPAPGRRRGQILAGSAAVAAIVLLVIAVTATLGSEEILVEVPAGTAERMAAGEEIELLPRTLRVSVGDRLRIVNHDDQAHEVGPYAVAAGQTLEQTFTSPGTLEGLCTLHPSGAITIEVR
jgi:plastocyanin